MINRLELQPGISLRCRTDTRFKMNCLSLQLVRPLCRQEASCNALLSAVLLRGSALHPDMQSITRHLDDLYGATVGSLVRSVGDYQTTGFYCGFTEDRFALGGDAILAPMMAFVGELLKTPKLEKGVFAESFVEGEKRNLLSAIEAGKNDKRTYAASQLMKQMCAKDPVGISRLGEREQVLEITSAGLFDHYQKILKQSRIELFYVGSQPIEAVAELVAPIFRDMDRDYSPLPPQTPFCDGGDTRREEIMDVTQGKLAMGFIGPGTVNTPDFVPMQVLNSVFGGGMTSKLFMNIRERDSLCYDISSGYMGGKGILSVVAGMDCGKTGVVEEKVLRELENCRRGDITPAELESARLSLLSSLRSIPDSPSSIENYYATAALSGLQLTTEQYAQQIRQVTAEQVAQMAGKLRLHSVFTLKGVQ